MVHTGHKCLKTFHLEKSGDFMSVQQEIHESFDTLFLILFGGRVFMKPSRVTDKNSQLAGATVQLRNLRMCSCSGPGILGPPSDFQTTMQRLIVNPHWFSNRTQVRCMPFITAVHSLSLNTLFLKQQLHLILDYIPSSFFPVKCISMTCISFANLQWCADTSVR